MAILLKFLMYVGAVACAGKLIYAQHFIFAYNSILQQAVEDYYVAFANTAIGYALFF